MIIAKDEPDEFLKAVWDLNKKYPDYVTCVQFDHVSLPFHCMAEAREIFRKKLQFQIEQALGLLYEQTQIFQEEGHSTVELLNLRKKFRAYRDLNLDACQSVDELEALFPIDLREYLLKNLRVG